MPALMNCGTVRVVYSAPSKWYRVLCSRHLQLWCPSSPSSFLPESLDTKVTKVTRGIGFSVLYAPSSPLLWFWGEHPPISGSERGDLEQVSLPGGQLVKQVAVGRRHVVALTTMGEVYSIGLNSFAQCGFPIPTPPDLLLSPQHVKHLPPGKVTKVCCGLDHTHFLSSEGFLFSCGWSDDGQTGTGCYGNVTTPTEVTGDITTERVRDFHCSADSSLAVTEVNSLHAWGNNEYGQLPINSEDLQVCVPQRVISLSNQHDDESVVAVTAGSSFSAVLTRHGNIYYSGRLGGIEEDERADRKKKEHWKLLFDGTQNGVEVADIRAGLHYIAAVEAGRRYILLWGRYHASCEKSLSPLPTEVTLPSSLLDWDAGPLELCLLLT